MLCHTIALFIAVLIYAVILIIILCINENSKKVISQLLKCTLTVLLITSFIWLPLLEMLLKMDLKVENDSNYINYKRYNIIRLFEGKDIYYENLKFDVFLFLLCFLRFFIKKDKYKHLIKTGDLFVSISIILFLITTNIVYENIVLEKIYGMIQFNFRLFSYSSIFLSIESAIYMYS